MKYFILIAAILIGASSCKKDFTCDCYQANGDPYGGNHPLTSTKRGAKKHCKEMNAVVNPEGGHCELVFK